MTKSPSVSLKNNSGFINSEVFLEIENIVKSYPNPEGNELVILDGINLTIGEDEYISVIG
ncbi:MAG TPA: bacitracin ABC transporter ATP-binding protein, partial [Cyanobacteria bacterium UBA11148]|nr:bacitracin ABC transporter ATP-binding protein [Cyanobacteria bacterium UBA11148]